MLGINVVLIIFLFSLFINTRLTVVNLPIKGTESDVAGMISATSSMKTVSESKTVIPGNKNTHYAHTHTPSYFTLMRFQDLLYSG